MGAKWEHVEVRYIHRLRLEPLLVSKSGAIVRAGSLTATILVPTLADFLAVNRASMDALIALRAGAAIPAQKVKSKRLVGVTDSLELALENDQATARNLFCNLLSTLNCSLMQINCDLISLISKAENRRKSDG